MRKKSTLIYFVKQFNSDSESNFLEADDRFERVLAKMEQDEKLPSDRAIQNILDFARTYEVIKTKETGYVEMILN
jgi:hypothetical protein